LKKKIENNNEITIETVKRTSMAAGVFYQWIMCINNYFNFCEEIKLRN
jgi:hypothetical protein